jgi:hypothetical protein
LNLDKKDDVKRELSLPQKVWLYALLGSFFAMFLGIPPGVAFWGVLGIGLVFGSLLVLLVLELRNKPGR